MSATAEIDMTKLNAFLGKAVIDLGATFNAGLVVIGDKLGLYKAMAGAGPMTPARTRGAFRRQTNGTCASGSRRRRLADTSPTIRRRNASNCRRPPSQADGGLRRPHALHLQVRRRRPAAGQRQARARPRLPGLRDPDGPPTTRSRMAARARRDLHLLRGHDARARIARDAAGGRGAGADVRMVYSPLDALRIAKARTRTVRSSSSRSGSNDGALDRADARARPRRGRPQLLRDGATTSRSCRRCARCSSRPTCGWTGSSAPATSARSLGARPFEFIPRRLRQAARRLRLRAAGPPAVRPHDRAPARPRGAARWRTSTPASSPYAATCEALAGPGRGVRAAPALRVARARGSSRRATLKLLGTYAGTRRRTAATSVPGRPRRRSQGVPVR